MTASPECAVSNLLWIACGMALALAVDNLVRRSGFVPSLTAAAFIFYVGMAVFCAICAGPMRRRK